MIQFNKLEITPEGDLIIDIQVEDLEYYEEVYLKEINIDSIDTYDPLTHSSTPCYTKVLTGANKEFKTTITKNEILADTNNTILFIWVSVKGTPSADTPCGKDTNFKVKAVVPLHTIYKESLKTLKEVECTCDIPKNFIDYILRVEALNYSILTENYNQSIKYWNTFFSNNNSNVNINCNCYGK